VYAFRHEPEYPQLFLRLNAGRTAGVPDFFPEFLPETTQNVMQGLGWHAYGIFCDRFEEGAQPEKLGVLTCRGGGCKLR
jgi:hypothetical protein